MQRIRVVAQNTRTLVSLLGNLSHQGHNVMTTSNLLDTKCNTIIAYSTRESFCAFIYKKERKKNALRK